MPDLDKLLVDTISFRATVLEESSKIPGAKYVARGEFARSDRATENKRLYPHSLWERELTRIGKQLNERKVYGELDHPMDGRTQLKRASHIVTDLHLEGSVVIGTAHIMDTDAGRNLKAILDAGGAVGVSSRGFGTTKPNLKGEDVVQEDYKLMTFDFVAEPAMSSAYPEVQKEDKSEFRPMEAAMAEELTFRDLREKNPTLHESFMQSAEREYENRMAEVWAKKIMGAKDEATTDLRSEFAEKLEAALKEARVEIEKSVRDSLMANPEVGGAKQALGEMKDILRRFVIPEDVEHLVGEREEHIGELQNEIAERDLHIANLQQECDKLAAIAKKAGYLYHLESKMQGLDNVEYIRSCIGNVGEYDSLEEMEERLASVLEEVDRRNTQQSERDDEVARLQESLELQKKISAKALEATQQLAARVYLEQRLTNHPEAGAARALVESREPSTKEEVDRLLDSVRSRPSMTEDIETTRMRVRQLVNSSTREYLQEDQHNGPKGGRNGAGQNYNGLGAPLEEIRNLAGYEDPNSN